MSPTPQKSPVSAVDAPWLNWLPKIAGTLALFLVIGYALTFRELSANANPAAWGAFGDYVGGLLNPLISLFTLIVAMKVWGLQKTELLETRKAVEEQGKTAEQQRREQRFFDLLAIYQVTLQSINFEERNAHMQYLVLQNQTPIETSTRSGKQAFLFLTSSLRSQVNTLIPLFKLKGIAATSPSETPTSEIITETWGRHSPLLDHYFRTVFMLLREAALILKEDHFRYIKLFRAQLSRDEVNLLAMNLLYAEEGKKMRLLAANYGLLKHMPANPLRKIVEGELDPLSFGRKWAEERILTPREAPHAD